MLSSSQLILTCCQKVDSLPVFIESFTTMDDLLRRELRALITQADGFDQSWSITQEHPVEERCLMFFDMNPRSVKGLERAAQLLGMSNGVISKWRSLLQGCDAIGLGLSKSLKSVRLYAQFWDQQIERVLSENLDPFALYLGVKSLPDGSLRQDTYRCEPLLARTVYWPEIEKACAKFSMNITDLETAMSALNDENGVWTRIDNSGRDSWLLTVRKAEPEPALVAQALSSFKGHSPDMLAFCTRAPMLHIAAGEDPVKGDFISFYFEAEADDIIEFLEL